MESTRNREVKRRTSPAETRGNSLPQPDALHLAGALQSTLNSLEDRDFTLDIQQESGLQELGKAIVGGTRSGYLEMATSTGKTAIEALVAEAAVKAGQRVLMLAPKLSIARQIVGANQETPTGLARFTNLLNTTTVGRHYGSAKARSTDQVVVSTYQSFLNDSKNDVKKLGEFDVIIADECHRSLGFRTAEAMKNHSPDALRFGFSATPDYADDRQADEIFNQQIFEFSLIDAVESGRTAPIRTLLYETDAEIALVDQRSEYTERELAPLIENPERNGTAFQLASALVAEGRQGIIACIPGDFNNHARLMAELLNKHADIRTAEIGSHLSEVENTMRLAAFQQGLIQVLTFTRALEEGWDSDKASFCINMAPTSSPVRTKQLLGRVLRKNSDDKESVYVDFVDNTSGGDKEQYTALHALEIATIDSRRVLGRNIGSGTWDKHKLPGLASLSDELVERITRSNGRTLSDIMTSRRKGTEFDPIVMHWERVLSREGMPSELPEDSAQTMSPAVISALKTTRKELFRSYGEEPTNEALFAEAERTGRISSVAVRALKAYGVRTDDAIESLVEIIPHDEDFSEPERATFAGLQADTVRKVLDSLSERESGVISMRYGIGEGQTEHTLDEIGDSFGVTRERIRGIEKKTLEKLGTPGRIRAISTYRADVYDTPLPIDVDKKVFEKHFLRSPEAYVEHVTGKRYVSVEGSHDKRDLFDPKVFYGLVEQIPKDQIFDLAAFTELFKEYGDLFGISRQRFNQTHTTSSRSNRYYVSQKDFNDAADHRLSFLHYRAGILTGRMAALDSRYETRPSTDNRESRAMLAREKTAIELAHDALYRLKIVYNDFTNDRPIAIPDRFKSAA